MRFLAIGGLVLYGVANLFAGMYDLVTERRLAFAVDAALLATGGFLVIAAILAVGRTAFAFWVVVAALLSASALAVFNERVLGLGHPSHHIVRGLYTIIVFWAAFKALRHSHRANVGSGGAA